MVIKSTFKDYYDYVANQYGGGDPKIVYSRTRLSTPLPGSRDFGHPVVIKSNDLPLTSLRRSGLYSRANKRCAYLIIAGKAYLISRPVSDIDDNINGFRVEPLIDPEDEKRLWWQRYRPKNIEFGKEYPALISLSQEIGHPVFVVLDIEYGWRSSPTKVFISGQCPILQNIGVPSLIPATQMYQDLSYFVGNLMKSSPDVKPPVELSNNQKIVKAGFDLVKSFRHRT